MQIINSEKKSSKIRLSNMFSNSVKVEVYKRDDNYYNYEYIETISYDNTNYDIDINKYGSIYLLVTSTHPNRIGKFSIQADAIVDHNLPPGAIIGIVIGSIAFVICVGIILCCCVKMSRNLKRQREQRRRDEEERRQKLLYFNPNQKPGQLPQAPTFVPSQGPPTYNPVPVKYPQTNYPIAKNFATSE